MTPQDLEAIRARWAKATPGPWRSAWDHPELSGEDGEAVMIATVSGNPWDIKPGGGFVIGVLWHDGPLPCCNRENAAAIAAAPSDIQALLAHVAALEGEVERLTADAAEYDANDKRATAEEAKRRGLHAMQVDTLRAEIDRLRDGGDKCCECESGNVTRMVSTEEFPYGSGPDAVTLTAVVTSWHCGKCGMSWQGQTASVAQDQAVNSHLQREVARLTAESARMRPAWEAVERVRAAVAAYAAACSTCVPANTVEKGAAFVASCNEVHDAREALLGLADPPEPR